MIVREDLLGRARTEVPSVFNYKLQAEDNSMFNTPSTFAWYVSGLVLKWLKDKGGLAAIAKVNERKAAKVYACIDQSGGFYRNPVALDCRSKSNFPFTLVDSALDATFLEQCQAAGLAQLQGHRSVGGMRASIYNAMPEEGVDTLVQFMRHFCEKHG